MSFDLPESLRSIDDTQLRQKALDEATQEMGKGFLSGQSLRHCNLTGLRLSGLHLENVDFRDSICCGTTFSQLVSCNLSGTNLSHCYFGKLYDCNFRNAVVQHSFLGPIVQECDFTEAEVRHASFYPTPKQLQPQCAGNLFDSTSMNLLNATDGYLGHASIAHSRFTNSNLARASFVHSSLRSVSFIRANLIDIRLDDAELVDCKFDNCIFAEHMLDELERFDVTFGPQWNIARFRREQELQQLDEIVDALVDYRIDIIASTSDFYTTPRKIMITFGPEMPGPRAHVFRKNDDCFISMYSESTLSSLIRKLATDFLFARFELPLTPSSTRTLLDADTSKLLLTALGGMTCDQP